MATTPNYGFIMPDPTDFVTALPADFEIFGDEVDSRIKALNPETTEGDLAYRGATADAKDRLGIGTAGQVLAVNAGEDAPEWITLSGSGQGFTLLNVGGTSLTGSEVTITGINHEELLIMINGASATAASQILQFRFNSDSGTNYRYAGMQFIARGSYLPDIFQNLAEFQTTINAVQMNNNAAATMDGVLRVTACKSTDLKTFTSTFGGSEPGGSINGLQRIFQGVYEGGSAITSVNIRSTGTFDAGTVRVYGSVG